MPYFNANTLQALCGCVLLIGLGINSKKEVIDIDDACFSFQARIARFTLNLGAEEELIFIVDGHQATMFGAIDSTISCRLNQLFSENPEVDTIIMQYVPGSIDDEANLEGARLLREYNINTIVPADGMIASGGTDFFLAGVERTAAAGAEIGVHSWSNGSDILPIELPRDHEEHQKYLEYYRDMEIPESFYWFTLEAAPAESIHIMTPDEWKQYNIVTNS